MRTLKEKFVERFTEMGSYKVCGTPHEVYEFFAKEIDKVRNETIDKIEVMIVEEMNIANSEGQPTSRLTSLAVRLKEYI